MDPLSITAAAAGFLSLAGQLGDGLLRLQALTATFRHASEDVQILTAETDNLRYILDTVGSRLYHASEPISDVRPLQRALDQCRNVQGKLNIVLASLNTRKRSATGLRMIMKKGSLREILLDLERSKSSLLLAFQSFEAQDAMSTKFCVVDLAQLHRMAQAESTQRSDLILKELRSLQRELKRIQCSDHGQVRKAVDAQHARRNFEASVSRLQTGQFSDQSKTSMDVDTGDDRQVAATCSFETMTVHVNVPLWFVKRQYSICVRKAISGWTFTFRSYRIVTDPFCDPFLVACLVEPVSKVRSLLLTGQASLFDQFVVTLIPNSIGEQGQEIRGPTASVSALDCAVASCNVKLGRYLVERGAEKTPITESPIVVAGFVMRRLYEEVESEDKDTSFDMFMKSSVQLYRRLTRACRLSSVDQKTLEDLGTLDMVSLSEDDDLRGLIAAQYGITDVSSTFIIECASMAELGLALTKHIHFGWSEEEHWKYLLIWKMTHAGTPVEVFLRNCELDTLENVDIVAKTYSLFGRNYSLLLVAALNLADAWRHGTEAQIQGWERIVLLVVRSGADLHVPLCRASDEQLWITTMALFICRSAKIDERVQAQPDLALQRWARAICLAVEDIEEYGRRELEMLRKARPHVVPTECFRESERFRGFLDSVLGFSWGKGPSSWAFQVSCPGDEYAGEFWCGIEHAMTATEVVSWLIDTKSETDKDLARTCPEMPGSWTDHTEQLGPCADCLLHNICEIGSLEYLTLLEAADHAASDLEYVRGLAQDECTCTKCWWIRYEAEDADKPQPLHNCHKLISSTPTAKRSPFCRWATWLKRQLWVYGVDIDQLPLGVGYAEQLAVLRSDDCCLERWWEEQEALEANIVPSLHRCSTTASWASKYGSPERARRALEEESLNDDLSVDSDSSSAESQDSYVYPHSYVQPRHRKRVCWVFERCVHYLRQRGSSDRN